MLDPVRSGEVYAPGEEIPERQPFFKPGGPVSLFVILATFAFVVWMRAEGYSAAVHDWVRFQLFGV